MVKKNKEQFYFIANQISTRCTLQSVSKHTCISCVLPSAAKRRQQRTFQARHVQWTKINRQELACPAQCRWLLSTNTSWSQQCREMLMGYLKWTWKSKANNEPKISRNTRRWNLRYRQLNFKNVGETRGATHYSLGRVWAVKKKRFLFIL